jgi:nucleotide-binding universal stress UspA family protein
VCGLPKPGVWPTLAAFLRQQFRGSCISSSVRNPGKDAEAAAAFETARQQAADAGVPIFFLYCVAYSVAEAILEMAATQAVDALFLGTTQRGSLWRTMKGMSFKSLPNSYQYELI